MDSQGREDRERHRGPSTAHDAQQTIEVACLEPEDVHHETNPQEKSGEQRSNNNSRASETIQTVVQSGKQEEQNRPWRNGVGDEVRGPERDGCRQESVEKKGDGQRAEERVAGRGTAVEEQADDEYGMGTAMAKNRGVSIAFRTTPSIEYDSERREGMQKLDQSAAMYVQGEKGCEEEVPVAKDGKKADLHDFHPGNLTEERTVSVERTLSIDQQLHVMKAQATEKFAQQARQGNKYLRSKKLARMLQTKHKTTAKTAFELRGKDRASLPGGYGGVRAQQIGFKAMFYSGKKQASEDTRGARQASFKLPPAKNRIYPKGASDNFEEFLESQASGYNEQPDAKGADGKLYEATFRRPKQHIVGQAQAGLRNQASGTQRAPTLNGSMKSSERLPPSGIAKQSKEHGAVGPAFRLEPSLEPSSIRQGARSQRRHLPKKAGGTYPKNQLADAKLDRDDAELCVLDSQKLLRLSGRGLLPKYIERNTTIFQQQENDWAKGTGVDMRWKTLIFLKLYELFYPGDFLADHKAMSSGKTPSESEHAYHRRRRSMKQEEKAAYLQFYQLMINVEKTLLHYQDVADHIFLEDVLDILTPESFLSAEDYPQGADANSSMMREELSHLVRRKRQFLHKFVRFKSSMKEGEDPRKSWQKREMGSRCPICTNTQFNEFLMEQDQNLSSDYFVAATGLNQTFQNGNSLIHGRRDHYNQEKFSKLIEMARFGSYKDIETRGPKSQGGPWQSLAQTSRRMGCFSGKENPQERETNQAGQDGPRVKVQFFGENQIIFHNQKMMKKLVKKELLADFGGAPRRHTRAGRRRQDEEADQNQSDSDDHHLDVLKFNVPSDYASPSLFKDAGGEREELSIVRRLNLSIVDEPAEDHPIRIDSDNKQDFIVAEVVQEHVDFDDAQEPPVFVDEDQPTEQQQLVLDTGPNESAVPEQVLSAMTPEVVVTDQQDDLLSLQEQGPRGLEARKERARQYNQTLASVAPARTPIDGDSSAQSQAQAQNYAYSPETRTYNDKIHFRDQRDEEKGLMAAPAGRHEHSQEISIEYGDPLPQSLENPGLQTNHGTAQQSLDNVMTGNLSRKDKERFEHYTQSKIKDYKGHHTESGQDAEPAASMTISYRDKAEGVVFQDPVHSIAEPVKQEELAAGSQDQDVSEPGEHFSSAAYKLKLDEFGLQVVHQENKSLSPMKMQSNQGIDDKLFREKKPPRAINSQPFASLDAGTKLNLVESPQQDYHGAQMDHEDQSRCSMLRSRGLYSVENNEAAEQYGNQPSQEGDRQKLAVQHLVDLKRQSSQLSEPSMDTNPNANATDQAAERQSNPNNGPLARCATTDHARDSRKDSQQFVEFTEIYGDVENCDLCGEEFERHHRDYNLEMNLRIEYMREVLNQTQKDQTLAHSILQSRHGSISRKLDYVQNMNSKKDLVVYKHITTLNSPAGKRPSLHVPGTEHLTPMNKHLRGLDEQMAAFVHFQTNLNDAVVTRQPLAHEQRVKSKFESIKQSASSQATVSIARKKRLDVNTIKSMLPDAAAEQAEGEDEANEKSPAGDVNKDAPSQNDPAIGRNVTASQQYVINRSKSTQSTSALVKVKDPTGKLTLQVDQDEQAIPQREGGAQGEQRQQNTLELVNARPLEQVHQGSRGISARWRARLRELEPYYENEKLCQLCFNVQVQNEAPDNNFCDDCIRRLNQIHEAEEVGHLEDDNFLQNDRPGFENGCCQVCGLKDHATADRAASRRSKNRQGIESRNAINERMFVYPNCFTDLGGPSKNAGYHDLDGLEAPDHQGFGDLQSCQNHIRALYTRVKLKQFRHLYEFCQTPLEQQEILQQAQHFQFCLSCDRVIRKYSALRCQHLTCEHCNITFCMYCREIIFYQKWKQKDQRIASQRLQILKDHFNPFSLNSCKMMSGTKNYKSYKEQIRIRENIQNSVNISHASVERHTDQRDRHSRGEAKPNANSSYGINLSQYLNEQAKKVAYQGLGEPDQVQSSIIDFKRFGGWTASGVRWAFAAFAVLWIVLGVPVSLVGYLTFGALNAWNCFAQKEKSCYYVDQRASCCRKSCRLLAHTVAFLVLLPVIVPLVFFVIMSGVHGLLWKLVRPAD